MSMKKKIKRSEIILNLIVITVTTISYIGYLLLYFNLDIYTDQTSLVFLLSWLGIFFGIYILVTWYKLTGTFFSLYTIFMLFFFLFNYGQPLMWALGIHQSGEIGQVGLYTLGKPSTTDIVLSQAITLSSILLFHFGAFYSYKGKNHSYNNLNDREKISSRISQKAIYKVSYLLSFIAIPVTFYNAIYKFIISQQYSYRDFYYNDEVVSNIGAFNLIENLFFPCLIGLLIGSNYKRNNKFFVYFVFFLYIFISILSGDRGNWVMKLIILIWMSHTYYKKIQVKKYLKYLVTGLLGLQVLEAIISVRNTGINVQNIVQAFSFEESALISAVYEMGSSMRPTIVLMKYGWDIWPYGNTYINALLGIVSSRTMTIIDRPWAPLSDWFSQVYLKIPYGAGFSIVAEPLINFGPIIAPLFMIILGFIVSSLTYVDKSINIDNRPLKVFFSISTMSFLTGLIRNHSLWVMKSWFYGVVIFMILILLMREYIRKNKSL